MLGHLFNWKMVMKQIFFNFEHGYIGEKDDCNFALMLFTCE